MSNPSTPEKENGKSMSDTMSALVKEAAGAVKSKAVAAVTGKAPVKVEGNTTILNDYYRIGTGTYKILQRNVQRGTPFLLLGPTGVGKTELIDCLAKTEGLPLTIFDMGTMTDPIMALVGTHVIKVKGGVTQSEFVPSRFSEVIQHPGIVLLDELSRSSPQANNLLFPVLDFRKSLSMEYSFDDQAPIKVHPQCVFAATANLGSQYTGAHKLDKALIDRFMLIEVDALDKDQIKRVVSYHYPKIMEAKREMIVNCYLEINKAHDDYTISFNLSIRHLKMVCDLVSDKFSIYDAFYAICKGIGSKEGLKSLEAVLNKTMTPSS